MNTPRWHAGPHSATYSDIFVNTAHNTKRQLMNDCFRCHGMYFDGSIRDIVQPQDTQRPVALDASGTRRPGDHSLPGLPLGSSRRRARRRSRRSEFRLPAPPVHDSVALYDRREQMHFAAASLGDSRRSTTARAQLKVSPDPRQAICYQCHAPRQPEANSVAAANHWGPQAGSGDDRTPMGVHEGLSCVVVPRRARRECARLLRHLPSRDVALRNRRWRRWTPRSPVKASEHNIHWVKCTDCHQHGVPQVKKAALVSNTNPIRNGQ